MLTGAGVLAGILPLAHMHSFLAVVLISGPLCIIISLTRQKFFLDWLCFAIPASILSVTVYAVFFSGKVSATQFLAFYPGWSAKGGLLGWMAMWLRLWGVMLPVAIVGLWLIRKRPVWLQTVFFSFAFIFVVTNLMLFQAAVWDNSKLFCWAYLGFSGLAVIVLDWLWHSQLQVVGRLDAIVLALAMTFTGTLEAIRLQRTGRNEMHFFQQVDVELAQQIRQETDYDAIFLTHPTSNHFIMTWAARPILIGFVGWLPNFGFDYQQREQDVKAMFSGGEMSEQLLKQYQVSYVSIGPGELNDSQADESYFARRYPVAFENANYRIYDVRSIKSSTI